MAGHIFSGIPAAERYGEPLPEQTLEMIRRYRVALKGPCTTPVGKGYRSINVRLRQGLDLFASVRPVRTRSAPIPTCACPERTRS